MLTSFLNNIYINNSVSNDKVCSGCGCTCLASVRIAKNAQLVARIKYINYGIYLNT